VPLSMIRDGHLLIDPPSPGAWNMAVDEVLLDEAERGRLSIRFYAWTPSTLSLGYFQRVEHRGQHPASMLCPLVRRPSGGGAIVHDDDLHELTYSIALPGVTRARPAQQWLYDILHRSLVNTLSDWGIVAQHCAGKGRGSSPEPFLCFQRHTTGDVLLEGHKVAGSAQRRSPTALLQHGSVLLSCSAAAPELPGISQLSGTTLEARELRPAWLARLRAIWPVDWQAVKLSEEQAQRVSDKIAAKFAHKRWTERR
jgi:lipoate-protein ligase A